jgi:hypothetical protein
MRSCFCLTLVSVLLLWPHASVAAPILYDMGGFGGADTLQAVQDFFLSPDYRPSHLMARFVCKDEACSHLEGIDGRIDAELFDVVANPGGTSGTFAFDGLIEWIHASTSLTWHVQYFVIHRGFGSEVFAVAPDSAVVFPVGLFFSGGPVPWEWTSGNLTHHLSFYGSAVRVPEPALLWLLAAGIVADRLRRLSVSRRRSKAAHDRTASTAARRAAGGT